ncbi:hypothetical protein FA95DRAFT_1212358 [Auriscalpium vulgare]|uniref:Uncharacterized protein n=1 Tax=Auriscalpium vulgare TaxID=40419 RepID=A0ACB8RTK2_9AGAM|nr:hypothetical protein FA95DRAFT_1212358 [Auriscalpium vulgare]
MEHISEYSSASHRLELRPRRPEGSQGPRFPTRRTVYAERLFRRSAQVATLCWRSSERHYHYTALTLVPQSAISRSMRALHWADPRVENAGGAFLSRTTDARCSRAFICSCPRSLLLNRLCSSANGEYVNCLCGVMSKAICSSISDKVFGGKRKLRCAPPASDIESRTAPHSHSTGHRIDAIYPTGHPQTAN